MTAAAGAQDSATAKKVAFSKDTAARSVTLEGDDFNPGGTLTGGSRKNASSALAGLHALAEAEAELAAHQQALNNATQGLAALAATAKEHQK
jgi:structural maintenance of chromosome 2